MTLKEIVGGTVGIIIIFSVGFGCGYWLGLQKPDCVVGYDDGPADIYWEDGHYTKWFGNNFTLNPGESVQLEIP